MDWLILAIIAATLPAIPNIFDKYVINNYKYDIRAFAW